MTTGQAMPLVIRETLRPVLLGAAVGIAGTPGLARFVVGLACSWSQSWRVSFAIDECPMGPALFPGLTQRCRDPVMRSGD